MTPRSHIELTEYRTARGVFLRPEECNRLLVRALGVSVSPSAGLPDCYDLTPERVGVIYLGNRVAVVRPRFGIRSALFLIAYSVDHASWQTLEHPLDEDATLTEALASIFTRAVGRAFSRGILQGYHHEEDALRYVRGR